MDLREKLFSPVHSWASCLVDQRHFSCPKAFAPNLLLGWRGLDLVVGWCNRICKWFVLICDLQDTPCTVQAHFTPMAYLCLCLWKVFVFVHILRSWSWFVSISSDPQVVFMTKAQGLSHTTHFSHKGHTFLFVPRAFRVTQNLPMQWPMAILSLMHVSDTYVGSAPSH